MCKYVYGTGKYGPGRCAHPSNLAMECVGEDSCRLMGEDITDVDDLETYLGYGQGDKDENCPNTTCGIYCQKYKRFYCAGEDHCQNEEDYRSHMNMYGGVE